MLYLSSGGVELSQDHQNLVKSVGFGEELAKQQATDPDLGQAQDPSFFQEEVTGGHLWLYDVPVAKEGKRAGQKLEGSAYFDKIPQEWKDKWADKEIAKSDWDSNSREECSNEFRDFINSHIPQFDQIIPYEEFYLYCEQARRWTNDTGSLTDVPIEEQYEWKQMVMTRMSQNSLYALNMFISIKEDGFIGGRRKYQASAPQALLAFVVDLGKSGNLLKGRQSAITSTMMALAVIKSIVIASFSGVFMVHKKDGTGKQLFRDKFQSTFQNMPSWMIAEVDVTKGFSTESAIMDYDSGSGKLNKGRDISEMRLLSAEDSMVANGKTPTMSFFDECQNIPTYQTIKGEIGPTMWQFNPLTGDMELVRQMFAWGTGSSNNTGGGSFEADFRSLLEAWQGGEDTGGWVPLFFDWTCRPGVNKAFYEREKAKYMRGQTEETKGLTPQERLSLFNAHYPRKPDDAFMSTHKTLIPMEIIVKQQNRIIDLCHKKGLAPQPGRFEPIFDQSQPMPEGSYFPFAVRGARWVPSFESDTMAPVRMFMPPNNSYVGRYYQGTDPIQNDGGFSRFSSCIVDMGAREVGTGDNSYHVSTVACVLNSRAAFPQELFVQSALMGMYYKNYGQKACKELVEINAGSRYVDFKSSPIFNLKDSLVYRTQLEPKYRGGTHIYGVDLKGGKNSRKEALYSDVVDILRTNWMNIWYYDIWTQIRHISVQSQPDGSVQWGTQNKNVYNDDMVYAMGYAFICARTMYQYDKTPRKITPDTKEYRTKRVIKRDENHMPYWVTEKVEVTYG